VRRGALYAPPVISFALYSKSSGNPYLKILDFSQLFIVYTPMKKKIKNFVLPMRRPLFAHPVQKYFIFIALTKKNLLQPLF